MTRARLPLFATVALLLALGAYVAARFQVTSDVSLLLPPSADSELLGLTRRVADSELARTMVVTVAAPDADTAVNASRAFEDALRAEPRVASGLASLEGGPAAGIDRAVYELYHPRRFAFFAPDAAQARAALTPGALSDAARRLKQRLEQPMSPLVSALAPGDPTLVLARLFERLQQSQGQSLMLRAGRFLTADGRYAVLLLRTRAAGFDADAQAPLLGGVRDAFERVNARFGQRLRLEASGVNRFAVRAKESISADIERVSTLSMLGLAALLFLLFRSGWLVFAAGLPLGAGFLAGCAACLAVYGRVHGITLAFGSSLLGVALDYVEHVYCHQAVAPHPDGARGTLRSIGPALWTGAGTTLLGFAALAGSGFRGLEEVALFSSVGLLGSLLCVFTVLPELLPARTPDVALRTRLVAGLAAFFVALRARRRVLWLLPAAACALVAIGMPRVQLSQDFTLGQVDPQLRQEDERVRSRVLRFDQMRFAVALGADDEAALRSNDQVAAALRAAVNAGELAGFVGVAELLPSAELQRGVEREVRAALGDGAPLLAAYEAEGFRPEAFAPLRAALSQPAAAPLSYADLAASPLAGLVRPMRLTLKQGVGFMTFLHGVRDAPAVARRLAAIDSARFVDQQRVFQDTHRAYLRRTAELVAIGSALVLLLLVLRYRDLRRSLAAFLPSALSAAVTVAVLALLGRQLDLVALAGLLMVVSMGVDYGVFLVDAHETEQEPTTALLSIFFAATTSVLGFGLLALSAHPMLSLIGTTAFVGMTLCALLAPTTLALLGRPRPVSNHTREVPA